MKTLKNTELRRHIIRMEVSTYQKNIRKVKNMEMIQNSRKMEHTYMIINIAMVD